MKKWLLIGLSLLVLLGIGAKVAFDYAADKTMKKVTDEVMKDPTVKKMLEDKELQAKLEEAVEDPAIQAEISKANDTSAVLGDKKEKGEKETEKGQGAKQSTKQTIQFKDNSEAMRYAMKRFSVSEMNEYRSMVSAGLTAADKKKIKQDILSRFSPEEIKAFIETAQNNK